MLMGGENGFIDLVVAIAVAITLLGGKLWLLMVLMTQLLAV